MGGDSSGIDPRLIVGATDGKLIVGGSGGSPDKVAFVCGDAPVIKLPSWIGVAWGTLIGALEGRLWLDPGRLADGVAERSLLSVREVL